MSLIPRTIPERVVYVGFKHKDGIICTYDLDSGEGFVGVPTITIEAGGGVTMVAASAAITMTNQPDDTIGAIFEAVSAGTWTITLSCVTTTGEVKGGYIIWEVKDVPT